VTKRLDGDFTSRRDRCRIACRRSRRNSGFARGWKSLRMRGGTESVIDGKGLLGVAEYGADLAVRMLVHLSV